MKTVLLNLQTSETCSEHLGTVSLHSREKFCPIKTQTFCSILFTVFLMIENGLPFLFLVAEDVQQLSEDMVGLGVESS